MEVTKNFSEQDLLRTPDLQETIINFKTENQAELESRCLELCLTSFFNVD